MDLAGFTALTAAHGDDHAADVFDAFASALDRACGVSDDVTCVKHLGDGALLVSTSGEVMLAALLRGVEDQGDLELRLRVRAGVHAGPVLRVRTAHGLDYLGHTANVAARLCSLAAPGELLFSDALVGSSTASSARALGLRSLRHVPEAVGVWSLPLGTQDSRIDPVCHMTVGNGGLTMAVGGHDWLFCSVACRDRFELDHG